MIEPLESLDVYKLGTHQINTKRDGAIVIQSRTIDLNKYLDEEVLVEGAIEYGIGNAEPVLSVEKVSYVDESKAAELISYENKSYGFAFDHPDTWLLIEGTNALTLSFEEEDIITLVVFAEEQYLDALADSHEDGEGVEVTIGAQRSLRYITGDSLRFYVPNPPKEKIYQITLTANAQLEAFYDLLESFQLIYLTQIQGDPCGGTQQIECPEQQICQLEGASKYAEGVCVGVGDNAVASSCPFIAPPASCNEYRISEYSIKGCPSRYECVSEGTASGPASFRDLNVVDAGDAPEGYEPKSDDETAVDEDEEVVDDREYDVPNLSDVTGEYTNSRRNFEMLYPKRWYYNNFGYIDGNYTIGFADAEMDEAADALILITLSDKDGGVASAAVDGTFYQFNGPSDLSEIMEEMANTIAELEGTN